MKSQEDRDRAQVMLFSIELRTGINPTVFQNTNINIIVEFKCKPDLALLADTVSSPLTKTSGHQQASGSN